MLPRGTGGTCPACPARRIEVLAERLCAPETLKVALSISTDVLAGVGIEVPVAKFRNSVFYGFDI